MLGKCINITSLLNQKQAETIAQWIGCSNVMRNQKIDDLKNLLDSNQPVNYAYAHIKAKKELKFLKDVPPSVLRNAASAVVKTFDKCVKGAEIVEGLRPKGRSNRLQKSYDKLSKYHNKIANIKDYFLHRTSKAIVEATPKLCVFEDLKIKNMVKRPKKVKEGRGYAKNGARRKSGLNRAMHEVALGHLIRFLFKDESVQ